MAFIPQTNYTDWAIATVGEVSAHFCGKNLVYDQYNGCLWPLFSVLWTGAANFHSHDSSVNLMRLSGPRSKHTTSQKIW
jgi:hypothetical protein